MDILQQDAWMARAAVIASSGRNIRLDSGPINTPARERFYLVKMSHSAQWRVDCGADRGDGRKGCYTIEQALAGDFLNDEAKALVRHYTGAK